MDEWERAQAYVDSLHYLDRVSDRTVREVIKQVAFEAYLAGLRE